MATTANNPDLNTVLALGVVVVSAAMLYRVSRQLRAPALGERHDDPPSLHSVVSAFPRNSRIDRIDDTAPSVMPRPPEWDWK